MEHWLLERFRRYSDRPFLALEGAEYSYSDLVCRIEHLLDVLREHNIGCGDIVLMHASYDLQSAALVYALYLNQSVVVPICDSDTEFVNNVSRLVDASFYIDAQLAIVSFKCQTVCHSLVQELVESNDSGLILLSSGTTGAPKAMLLSLSRLVEKYKDRPDRSVSLLWFLLFDHIGGFNTFISATMNGGKLIPASSKTPDSVCQLIQEHKVQVLPTTPTFINILLLSKLYEKYDLSSLTMITYGTEPMPVTTLRAANKALPHIRFKQTYGLSETGILPTKSESGDSLWIKIGDENTLTEVRDNILWVKTTTAMLGYLNAPSPFDDKGWLCTGDIVETKGSYFRILGRKKTIINVGGEKAYPAEIENVLLELDIVLDAVVWPKKNPVTGQVVAATIKVHNMEQADELKLIVKKHCQKKLPGFQVPRFLQFTTDNLHSERFKRAPSPQLTRELSNAG